MIAYIVGSLEIEDFTGNKLISSPSKSNSSTNSTASSNNNNSSTNHVQDSEAFTVIAEAVCALFYLLQVS
jgi:hypothetical protein